MLSTIAAGSSVIYAWLVLFILGACVSLWFISWAAGRFARIAQLAWERTSIGFRSPYLKRYLDVLKSGCEIIAAAGISSYLTVLVLDGLLESGFWSEVARETGLLLFWADLIEVGFLTLVQAGYRGDTIIRNQNLLPRE